MAYTLDFSVLLGSSRSGLTLAAQLRDSAGTAVGSEITTGFVEVGSGGYTLSTSIPDGHRGRIDIYQSGVPATVLAFTAINPQEAEYVDVAVSTRLASASYTSPPSAGDIDVQLISTHGSGSWVDTIAPSVTDIDTRLSTTHGSGSWLHTTPQSVWEYTTRTLTSFGALVSQIWNYISRTLTSRDETDLVVEETYEIYKFSTVSIPLTLGVDITSAENIYITCKQNRNDLDVDSIFQVGLDEGLIYLYNVELPTSTDAEITITDYTNGEIELSINADAASLLPIGKDKPFDVKVLYLTTVYVAKDSSLTIKLPVTRAIE